MKIIMGLGNPGEKYQFTRHNLGFMVIEQFLKDFETTDRSIWTNESKFKSEIATFDWQPKAGKLEKVILAKPKTYMNNSGLAAQLMSAFYKIETDNLWIVHDDVDIPLGNMKIRFGGASAGHKGVQSIIDTLKTDKFWRFRIGIGAQSSPLRPLSSDFEGQAEFRIQKSGSKPRKIKEIDDFVLGGFAEGERGKVREIIKKGSKALQMSLEDGLKQAMNRFNTK